jgi:hypothetical protein
MKRFDGNDDFEAMIRIFRESEGGRRSPMFNGVRCDFCYAEDDPRRGIWMIYPDFLDANGESIPENQPLPVDAPIPARMIVLSDNLRMEVHRQKARVGSQFFCQDGQRRIAEGIITKITGLFRERPERTPVSGA